MKTEEEICFDCGTSNEIANLTVIHEGVALCKECLDLELKELGKSMKGDRE